MKKLIILLLLAFISTGCSEETGVTIAVEEGYECSEDVMNAVKNYYNGDVVISEVDRNGLLDGGYDVAIGAVEMGRAIDYGVWKSRVMAYDNACCVSYDDYRISDDFSGKKAGIAEGFNYSYYTSLNDECEYSNYSNNSELLSDLQSGIIDVAICSADVADEMKESDNDLRINDLLDGRIYEYVVISKDIDLINSLDQVIE